MNGHARNLDALRGNPVINQLLSRLFARHQIERHVVAGPAFPETVTGVCDDRDERNPVGQAKLFQDAGDGMLSQGMNADDDVRAPTLEEVAHVTDSFLVEEFSRFRSKTIDSPVEIL